jgi:uridine kinase
VIVSGIPGAGKTTLAEELGRRLAVPVLAKDVITASLAARRYEARARAGGPARFAHPDELIIDLMRKDRLDWAAYDLAPLDLTSLVVDTTDAYVPAIDEIAAFATS